ncbi:type II toxin-antitoxin system HicB family antitoxin [Pectobacterium aroidearum]|jgi:predicted RNase H-like HicB family nuclease|uniref:Type II toxin-antitoxin system HicB family antitoxin n=1 Tax=Pectobacterium aroidearum TaxID=1201031 RepID=A0AAW3SXC2_9GAMM|nr:MULTISPECIES: type II toxin-antitoxin system HicB family antitoxin [Pectobacterium]UKE85414.1 type II toxin-antitoxin system HicB family antitoxin [Pectobacterium sp. PL152]MBA0206418.1 type II toxin-antitoxin system HicB family antitoxin [Pectobacterium aroidearum]MBA5201166.1 type II toxin-antitoxin system HicB family antitoxin [Pectobacterium aroidearum]MBA5205176.1 type II toxin-antitoxin system HicB family antitoxin [Pectobacterium aroidearum]MBA5229548.1 type II toxin-antitoxin system
MFYPIAIEAGDDTHAYGVTVPDLPGCFSAGDTLDDAIANAKEAITGHIELLVEMGQDIPTVSTVGQLAKGSEYAGYTWAVVDIDVTRLMGGSEKINVTLPKSLIDRIDRCVASNPEFKSRSGFLAQAALERISSSR